MLSSVFGVLTLLSIHSLAVSSPVTSEIDPDTYKAIHLPNNLQGLIVSSPLAVTSAVAININVGSVVDPVDFQGLAHLTEHMVFLASKTYPTPDFFQNFLAENGGSTNAYTADFNTNYYFNVIPSKLSEAIDVFAHFFIDPLFDVRYLSKEINAVESEYNKNLSEDSWKIQQVFANFIQRKFGGQRFSCGNLQSLHGNETEVLRNELLRFYGEYYHTKNMRFTVISPHSIEEIEKIIKFSFAKIPRKDSGKNGIDWRKCTREKSIFTSNLPQNSRIYLETTSAQTALFIWQIPCQVTKYRMNNILWLTSLLLQRKPNSVYSVLTELELAHSISVDSMAQANKFELFALSVDITRKGFNNIHVIIEVLYAFFEELEKSMNLERYEEISEISRVVFNNILPNSDEMKRASTISKDLSRINVGDVLTFKRLFREFNQSEVKSLLSDFRREKMAVLIGFPVSEGLNLTKIGTKIHYEPLYKTKFTIFNSINRKRNSVKRFSFLPKFPSKQILKPKKLQIASAVQMTKNHLPKLLFQQQNLKIWYQMNVAYKERLGFINCKYILQKTEFSPYEKAVKIMYATLLMEEISEILAEFDAYGVSTAFLPIKNGFASEINGISELLFDCLRQIISQMRNNKKTFFSIAKFKFAQEKLLVTFKAQNVSISLAKASENLFTRLQPNYFPAAVMYKAVKSLKLTDVTKLRTQISTNGICVECLFYGNFAKLRVQQYAQQLLQILPLARNFECAAPPKRTVKTLKMSATALFNFHPNPLENNNAVVHYYQLHCNRTSALEDFLYGVVYIHILDKLISGQFYTKLRTEQQLGYVVSGGPKVNERSIGYSLVVQTATRCPALVNKRISVFLKEMRGNIAKMTDLTNITRVLAYELLKPKKTVPEMAGRVWDEIVSDEYVFDRNQRMSILLKGVRMEKLLAFFDMIFVGGDRMISETYGRKHVRFREGFCWDEGDGIARVLDLESREECAVVKSNEIK